MKESKLSKLKDTATLLQNKPNQQSSFNATQNRDSSVEEEKRF